MPTKLSFTQFIDFLLWSLYSLEGVQGAGQLYDLSQVNQQLLVPLDHQLVIDAGKVLESRGLIRGVFALGGYVAAMLTGEGRLQVEHSVNDPDSFTAHLLDNPAEYVHWASPDEREKSAIAPPSDEEQRAPARAVLDELEQSIGAAAHIPADEKDDLAADLQAIRAQLTKREPNLSVIATLLSDMESWSFLKPQITKLTNLLFI